MLLKKEIGTTFFPLNSPYMHDVHEAICTCARSLKKIITSIITTKIYCICEGVPGDFILVN